MGRKSDGGKRSPKQSSKRQRPRKTIRFELIDLAEATSTHHGGKAVSILDMDLDEDGATQQTIYDYLLTREQLRLDLQQVFVSRDEENFAVAAFHFPSSGMVRQAKFLLPIRPELLMALRDPSPDETLHEVMEHIERAHGRRPISANDQAFLEQALVDFEQLCMNFMYAALPRLAKSAALLARLNLGHKPDADAAQATVSIPQPIVEPDGFEEFIVNVDQGWPFLRRRFKLHDIVRLPADHAKRDVESGYLVSVKDAERNKETWGKEYVSAIDGYRKRRLAEAQATRRRPKPSDMDALLATAAGRETRKRILATLNKIAENVIPATPGRPLARSPEATAALVHELRTDFNRRLGQYVTRGIKKTRAMIYDEMASDGRYGVPPESFTAATIENLLTRQKPRKPKHPQK